MVARLTDGTGAFDAEHVVEQLPAALELDVAKARRTVQDLAKDRKRTTLVQAISHLRQKKLGDTVKSLNNLLSCERAVPSSTPAQWSEHDELLDLYSAYAR